MIASTRNFSPKELVCTCCGQHGVLQWALDRLQVIRDIVDRPLTLASAYRCENHPQERIKTVKGQHYKGVAFDIKIKNSAERLQLVQLALQLGAGGIGVADTFVHIDFRQTKRAVMWTYN